MKRYAIIVAGGQGSRMGAAEPKQFLLLAGRPVLFHTLEKFRDAVDEIILVLPESYFDYWKKLCAEYQFSIPHKTVAGGVNRTESVKNGLNSIENEGVVAVHDAVRPLATTRLINMLLDAAIDLGSVIPAVEVKESLRQKTENQTQAVDRAGFIVVQTPQCFQVSILKKAYENAGNESFTDDATVIEASGSTVHVLTGEIANIKITYPEDLLFAEAILGQKI